MSKFDAGMEYLKGIGTSNHIQIGNETADRNLVVCHFDNGTPALVIVIQDGGKIADHGTCGVGLNNPDDLSKLISALMDELVRYRHSQGSDPSE